MEDRFIHLKRDSDVRGMCYGHKYSSITANLCMAYIHGLVFVRKVSLLLHVKVMICVF